MKFQKNIPQRYIFFFLIQNKKKHDNKNYRVKILLEFVVSHIFGNPFVFRLR